MKLLSTSIFILVFCISGVSQVKELQKSQDVRKQYIDPSESKANAKPAVPKLNFISYVNPFIGTGGHGHTYPGAAAPFGMVQVSPDTRPEGWDGCSGYHYSDSVIYGFSFTHLSGTGVPDLCDVLVVPQQGKALTEPAYLSKGGYGSRFSHNQEKASPGFYSVKLLDKDIDVELRATERCGLQQYTFNTSTGKKYILIDLDYRDQLTSAEIKAIDKTTLSGHRHSKGWATNQKLFFYMKLDVPFTKSTLITKGNKHKLLLEFPESTKQIILKTGISGVDEKGAEGNLKAEMAELSPKVIQSETERKWTAELKKIEFYSSDKVVMTNFYTAMYHSFLCPTLFTDSDGRYRGNDGKIHNAGSQSQYSIFSLWDTYRAAHPLYTITQTRRTEDFIQSFLRIYQQTGDLPVWELAGNETDCMIGYHSVSVILDAYRKGITNFDAKQALEAMVRTANLNEYGKVAYGKNGYLGTDIEPESVSKTLEYAYDDWCIAQFAKELGNDSIYQVFYNRSFNFMNVFDPETKFMRARRGGQWFSPFNPAEVNFNYTEANSWQYSLAAPQHIPALRQMIGGKDSLETWLNRLFTTESKLAGRDQVDITGLIGQYAHGNEPSHHMAYLYNYTNKPYKTQEIIDRILREMYHNAPDGLSGNEDCGQMSAWYVLSAMGIYPVCPGRPVYAIGRPLQTRASISLENGKVFTIDVKNNSPENKYIQSIMLNGVKYEKLFINHSDILAGGKIELHMGSQPNENLKSYESEIAEKEILPENAIPVPYFTATERIFSDLITTEIKMINYDHPVSSDWKSDTVFHGYFITFTTDGTEPKTNSERYSKPLVLNETTQLKARSFASYSINSKSEMEMTSGVIDGAYVSVNSPSVSATFSKTDKNMSIKLETGYANQYAANGPNSLIDGLRSGSTDYRSGDWQGYQGVDAKGVISFEKPKLITEIALNCLQDEHSWIFLPAEFVVEYSTDGTTYIKLPAAKSNISPLKEGQLSDQLKVKLPAATEVKSIRFTAKNRGVCPEGHISAGGKSWIFLDEITIK